MAGAKRARGGLRGGKLHCAAAQAVHTTRQAGAASCDDVKTGRNVNANHAQKKAVFENPNTY